MNVEKKFEILEGLPTYGPMHISISHTDFPFYSEGFVVRFFKNDSSSWVANFEPGWTDLNEVIEYSDINKILVIAGGCCYIMNPSEEKPISTFGVSYESILRSPDGRLILQDVTDITVIEKDLQYWNSERISWDGIVDLHLDGSLLSGMSYSALTDKWAPFTLNIETKKLSGGSYH